MRARSEIAASIADAALGPPIVVHTHAHNDHGPIGAARRIDENTGRFRPMDEHVIGPLQLNPRGAQRNHGVGDGTADTKRQGSERARRLRHPAP
jgi:hypothetical protein